MKKWNQKKDRDYYLCSLADECQHVHSVLNRIRESVLPAFCECNLADVTPSYV